MTCDELVEIMALASCAKVGDSAPCETACDGCKLHMQTALTALHSRGLAVVKKPRAAADIATWFDAWLASPVTRRERFIIQQTIEHALLYPEDIDDAVAAARPLKEVT